MSLASFKPSKPEKYIACNTCVFRKLDSVGVRPESWTIVQQQRAMEVDVGTQKMFS
jgi:hypothetical protein